ncbi:MAG: hypothetical protein B7Z37_23550, partial [Verrucomicrobia bacterium 12-59-8]
TPTPDPAAAAAPAMPAVAAKEEPGKKVENPAPNGEPQPIEVPEKDYRQLKAEDGLAAQMSIAQASLTDGGKKMEGEINSITFTTPAGGKLTIQPAPRSITGGQIHTADFGVMIMKPGANFSAELFITDRQITQIKEKIAVTAKSGPQDSPPPAPSNTPAPTGKL